MTAITDLDLFARVARTGNMSASGREMGLSPAVVSKRVRLLEEEWGALLFQRTTRQLTLTEIGESYYKRVVDILNLVEEADFVSRNLIHVAKESTFNHVIKCRFPEMKRPNWHARRGLPRKGDKSAGAFCPPRQVHPTRKNN